MKPFSLFVFIFTLLCCSCSKEDSTWSSAIFKVVEDTPSFSGCADISDKVEKKKCSDELLLAFISDHLQYPLLALAAGVEGTVVVKFVVEANGEVSSEKIVRDIGYGCGEAALKMVRLMPDWEPGRQRGTPVRVQINLPVKFEL